MSQADLIEFHRRLSAIADQDDRPKGQTARRVGAVTAFSVGAAMIAGLWYSPTYVRDYPDAPAAIALKKITSLAFALDNPAP